MSRMALSGVTKGRTKAEGNWTRATKVHGRNGEIKHVLLGRLTEIQASGSKSRTTAHSTWKTRNMLTSSPWFTVGILALCLVGTAVLYVAKDSWTRMLAVWGLMIYISLGTAGLIYASSRHAGEPDALSGNAPQSECTESAHQVIVGLSIHNFVSATFLGLIAIRRSGSKGTRRRDKGLAH
jgi:hypothetical protein